MRPDASAAGRRRTRRTRRVIGWAVVPLRDIQALRNGIENLELIAGGQEQAKLRQTAESLRAGDAIEGFELIGMRNDIAYRISVAIARLELRGKRLNRWNVVRWQIPVADLAEPFRAIVSDLRTDKWLKLQVIDQKHELLIFIVRLQADFKPWASLGDAMHVTIDFSIGGDFRKCADRVLDLAG